ncbi:unnamed protein product [Prunus armeniaca]
MDTWHPLRKCPKSHIDTQLEVHTLQESINRGTNPQKKVLESLRPLPSLLRALHATISFPSFYVRSSLSAGNYRLLWFSALRCLGTDQLLVFPSLIIEEGSRGVFPKNYRLTKRVRASEDLAPERDLESNFSPTSTPHYKQGSFMDKLLGKGNLGSNVGIDVSCLDDAYEDQNDEEDVVISCGEGGPCIQFSDRAMDHLCKPWKNALIIKSLGRSHTYNYLKAWLQQKWSLNGDWKLVDLVNDYFVVKFDIDEDLNFVLTGGPWIIVGQY